MNRRVVLTGATAAALIAVVFVSLPVAAKESPGLYNVKGWGGTGTYTGFYNPNNPTDHAHGGISCNCALDLEVHGDLGHPLYVRGPTARCVDSNGSPSDLSWNGGITILSGKLPPGLKMDDGGNISGIPTQHANFTVNVATGGVMCDLRPYSPYEQQIRFYIN